MFYSRDGTDPIPRIGIRLRVEKIVDQDIRGGKK